MQTEFEFALPKGYLDDEGNLHRKGMMRLATAMDEIVPLRDPRVKANPAYATVIILARVITQIGAVEEISPGVIERFFACDLSYLQTFYRQINELEPPTTSASLPTTSASPPTDPAPTANRPPAAAALPQPISQDNNSFQPDRQQAPALL